MGRLGSSSGMALDHSTARYWHNMIYSGLVSVICRTRVRFRSNSFVPQTPPAQVLPADIGGAAAYEVYRTWKYNSSLYAPLSADRMAQREGLIAMSIAEGTYICLHPLSLLWAECSNSSYSTMAVYWPRNGLVWSAGRMRSCSSDGCPSC